MGCITKLLEESRNACVVGLIPRRPRNTFNKLINSDEPLAEDILDPELDIRCGLVILWRSFGKGGEEGANLRNNIGPAIVKTNFLRHGCGMGKSVAGCGPAMCDGAGDWRRIRTVQQLEAREKSPSTRIFILSQQNDKFGNI